MVNQWELHYRTSAFEEGTLQHTLWVMLQHIEWPHTPQYTVYSAPPSAALSHTGAHLGEELRRPSFPLLWERLYCSDVPA